MIRGSRSPSSPRHPMTLPQPPAPDSLFLQARQPLVEGRFDEAKALLQRHLQGQPDDFRALGLLARCLRQLGRLQDAQEAAERSLQLQQAFPATWLELGLIQREQGDRQAAEHWLRRCLSAQPYHSAARWELAQTLATTAPQEALELLKPLREADPRQVDPALLEACLRQRLGQHAEAQVLFDRLLRQGHESLTALEGAYMTRATLNREMSERIALMRRIIELAPSAERWMHLSHDLREAGEHGLARTAIANALAEDPDCLPARWADFQTPENVAPESVEAAQAYRRLWQQGIQRFESIDFSEPHHRAHIWGCIGQSTAFYRHYLGDEVAMQRRYGQLLVSMMAAAFAPLPSRPLREGRRRIGFCSAHFFEHTVSRLFVPLIEAIDHERFDVYLFSLRHREDRWSARVRACGTFIAEAGDHVAWRERILQAELDVLIYPEIGMNPTVQGLAAMRLAPLQACLWGHPVTTGMDTIDLFLSAEALEPEGAEQHYSERLVRLPGLGHGLRRADLPEPIPPPADLVGPAEIELLCAQTVFKLMPEQDALFARILAALPQSRLHLLADDREHVRAWLRQRMAPILRQFGADPDRQLIIHGFVKHPYYLGLAQGFRLNLDSVGWSGGMSALDLLAQGLPTLCLPGESMRSRQTASLLELLDLPELIAADADDYVAKAIELARDPARCAALSGTLRARSDRLFGQPATYSALNNLLSCTQRTTDGELILPTPIAGSKPRSGDTAATSQDASST